MSKEVHRSNQLRNVRDAIGGNKALVRRGTAPASRRPLQPITHDTLQEQVHRRIRQGLIDGHFQPGEVLTIRYLAQQLGTSVMPVREALQKLTVERVLELTATRSVRVPVLSAEEFAEICDARMVLEGSITELAAQRADDTDIARMEAASRQFMAARSSNDRLLLLQKNREFHFSIYSAARHATLMGLIEPLWARSGPCTLALFEELTEEQVREGASPLHSDALEAIKARKPVQARRAIVADIQATSTRYQLSWKRAHPEDLAHSSEASEARPARRTRSAHP